MDKNSRKIIYGFLAAVLLILISYGMHLLARKNYGQIGENVILPSQTEPANQPGSTEYRNREYGFYIALPASWQNYSVLADEWKGYEYFEKTGDTVVARGPIISIRHPLWTKEVPRQDIPIMVFTKPQWADLSKEAFRIGAAPVGPTPLDTNEKYVFALPARYNYAFPAGYEEVEQIITGKSLRAF